MNIQDLFWLSLIIILEVTALYNVKYAATSTKSWWLSVAVVCYALIPVALFKIVQRGSGIAITNLVWNIASSLYGLGIGVILFREELTANQKIGVSLGLVSVWLMIIDSGKPPK